jgi:hypothetical protein
LSTNTADLSPRERKQSERFSGLSTLFILPSADKQDIGENQTQLCIAMSMLSKGDPAKKMMVAINENIRAFRGLSRFFFILHYNRAKDSPQ